MCFFSFWGLRGGKGRRQCCQLPSVGQAPGQGPGVWPRKIRTDGENCTCQVDGERGKVTGLN